MRIFYHASGCGILSLYQLGHIEWICSYISCVVSTTDYYFLLLIDLDLHCLVCSWICLLLCWSFVMWKCVLSSCKHLYSCIPRNDCPLFGTAKKFHQYSMPLLNNATLFCQFVVCISYYECTTLFFFTVLMVLECVVNYSTSFVILWHLPAPTSAYLFKVVDFHTSWKTPTIGWVPLVFMCVSTVFTLVWVPFLPTFTLSVVLFLCSHFSMVVKSLLYYGLNQSFLGPLCLHSSSPY